jgi:multiple sugar transport system permease protein
MQTRTEGVAGQVPRQKRGVIGRFANMSTLRRQQAYYAILFIVPGLAVYLIFMVYPFLNTIYLSFTNWNGVAENKDWVGLSHYARMFGDAIVLRSFFNNVIWVILGSERPDAGHRTRGGG